MMADLASQLSVYLYQLRDNFTSGCFLKEYDQYPDIDLPIVHPNAFTYTVLYVTTLTFLQHLSPFLGSHRLLAGVIQIFLQSLPTFLYLFQFNPTGLKVLIYNSLPIWMRPYILMASNGLRPDIPQSYPSTFVFILALLLFLHKFSPSPFFWL